MFPRTFAEQVIACLGHFAQMTPWVFLSIGITTCAAAPDEQPTEHSLQAEASVPVTDDSGIAVQFGLGGTWKLGHVLPLRIELPDAIREQATTIEASTLDGDGVQVIYSTHISPENSSGAESIWVEIRVGRQQAPLTIRVLDAASAVIASREYAFDQMGISQSSSQPLVVAIGSSLGVEELSRKSVDGSASNFSVSVIDTADSLPLDWRGYSSCDLLLLAGHDPQLIGSINERQWTAIDLWIRRGGGCIISLGSEAEDLVGNDSLAALLPGRVIGAGHVDNPGVLESLVATDQPLRGFPCSRLEVERGKVELQFRDSLSREVPWWISYPHGHGTLRFVASDLAHPSFANWKDRKLLWQRLVTPYLDRSMTDAADETQVGDSSYLGYSDLVGQLRASLDLFPNVRVVSFGQVAAILVGILILIGPIDYLVSVKWLKRPDFSWVLAGTTLIIISAALTWLYTEIRPSQVHVNTVQVVDLDAETGILNGRLWSHVYSGSARRLDMKAEAIDASAPLAIDWQGLPGRGLGGLLSQLNTDRGMPTYHIMREPAGETFMQGVGLPAAGTKCLFASWQAEREIVGTSQLREIPGVDQLEGELVNPLSVDLLEPMLFYHNWYYALVSRIPAGQSVNISFDTIPKDLSRRLNGRHTVDGNETIAKWDPADRSSIDRLLELMMFHKAAAGRTYTSLSHRYQLQMDQSNLLELDRAILVGRLENPLAKVVVSPTAENEANDQLQVQQDLNRVWCRIAIPVLTNKKN